MKLAQGQALANGTTPWPDGFEGSRSALPVGEDEAAVDVVARAADSRSATCRVTASTSGCASWGMLEAGRVNLTRSPRSSPSWPVPPAAWTWEPQERCTTPLSVGAWVTRLHRDAQPLARLDEGVRNGRFALVDDDGVRHDHRLLGGRRLHSRIDVDQALMRQLGGGRP